MKLSNHMKIFLKGLGCLLLAVWLAPMVYAQRWQLCELLPAANAYSMGNFSPQLLFDGSDAVIVGMTGSGKVRRAAPQPWSDDGCRIITVYDVTVEKIIAGHGPVSVPKEIHLELEGGEAPFGHVLVMGQPMMRESERFVAFVRHADHGRYAVTGNAAGKYSVNADGSLGDESEKPQAAMTFGKDMTLAEFETLPFGRGVSEEDARKPL